MTTIEWRERDRDEWQAAVAGFLLTIVLQPESPEEAWAWAVENALEVGLPIAAGYETSLAAAQASASRAALGSPGSLEDDVAER